MPPWVQLAVGAGVLLAVLAVGLSATVEDATYLLRHPGKLGRALLSMNVVMPLFAAAMIAAFRLRGPVAVALLTLAVSPIPPVLPHKAIRAGGAQSYTIGIIAIASLLAIVFVPLSIDLLVSAFGKTASVSPAAVARVVALTVLLPLAAGMLVRHLTPTLADRFARPASRAGFVLIAIGVVPILALAAPAAARLIGNGTLAVLLAFNVVGLASGHFLGGPDRHERTVLALTTASRHPGVALAVVSANVVHPEPVVAALVLYLLVNIVVTIPYAAWSKRRHVRRPSPVR